LLLDAFWSRTVTIVVSTYDGVGARRGQRSVFRLSAGRGRRHPGEGGRLENTPNERLKERRVEERYPGDAQVMRAAAGLGTGSSWRHPGGGQAGPGTSGGRQRPGGA
jgi:hypothetical protein